MRHLRSGHGDGTRGDSLSILPAFGDQVCDDVLARLAREQISGRRLDEHRADAVEIDLGVSFRRVRQRQEIEAGSVFAQHPRRRVTEAVVVAEHPQDPGLAQQPAPGVVDSPELQGSKGHLRVDGTRTVGRADDARLSAGTGARVARVPTRR